MKRIALAGIVLAGVSAAPFAYSQTVTVPAAPAVSASYRLISVAGSDLPTVYKENDAGRVDITAGTLLLHSDHSYTQRQTRRGDWSEEAVRVLHHSAASKSNTFVRDRGTYSIADTLITFTPSTTTEDATDPYTGSIRDGVIRFTSSDVEYVYSMHGAGKFRDATESAPVKAPRDSSIMARCLAAARLQTRAADEMTGPPSATVAAARDANVVSICKTMPGVFLPELR